MGCHSIGCTDIRRCPRGGPFIGILQAATQIQEMTLSFIPKLAAVAGVLFCRPLDANHIARFYWATLFRNTGTTGMSYAYLTTSYQLSLFARLFCVCLG